MRASPRSERGEAMYDPPPAFDRAVALFLLGTLLLNYPLLPLFNGAGTLFGVPSLYAYIFVAWGLLVVLLAVFIGHEK
jgi:hypothetical protein